MIGWIIGGILVVVLIVLVLWFVGIYNRFQSLKNSSQATLGQIRGAMKKRLDMINQLLGSVQSYAKFEKETLEAVTKMRSGVGTAGPGDLNEIEAQSKSILGRLFAVVESYPDLKTVTVVTQLTSSIRSIEDEIGRQRYTFNNISEQYNTMCDTIPSNIVASLGHFSKLEYLTFEEEIEQAPKIAF
jgi:LemA protein